MTTQEHKQNSVGQGLCEGCAKGWPTETRHWKPLDKDTSTERPCTRAPTPVQQAVTIRECAEIDETNVDGVKRSCVHDEWADLCQTCAPTSATQKLELCVCFSTASGIDDACARRGHKPLTPDPEVEIAALKAKLARAVNDLRRLVAGIDDWNEATQAIIGRVPNYHWGALEDARATLRDIGEIE